MVCIHCGKRFTCGCQKTKGVDGFTVHKTCVGAYNAKVNKSMPVKGRPVIRKNETLNKYDRARRVNH